MKKQKKRTAAHYSLLLKLPVKRESATGLINGTNAVFKVANPPIAVTTGKTIIPMPDDVTAELLKGTDFADAPVTSVGTVIDEDTGDSIYGSVTLTTPPSAELADSVKLSYYEECLGQIVQSIDPSIKQDKKETSSIGTNDKITSFGEKTREIKSDVVVNTATAMQIRKLMYDESAIQTGVTEGYTHVVEKSEPIEIMAAILVKIDGVIQEIHHLESCRIPFDFPSFKAGDAEVKITFDMSVDSPFAAIMLDELA